MIGNEKINFSTSLHAFYYIWNSFFFIFLNVAHQIATYELRMQMLYFLSNFLTFSTISFLNFFSFFNVKIDLQLTIFLLFPSYIYPSKSQLVLSHILCSRISMGLQELNTLNLKIIHKYRNLVTMTFLIHFQTQYILNSTENS